MPSRIAIVGEALSTDRNDQSFAGAASRYLTAMLSDTGISRRECLVTGVFQLNPYQPTAESLSGPAATAFPGYPEIGRAKYITAANGAALHRLRAELDAFKPNVVIALGDIASWALLKSAKIERIRGAPQMSHFGYKVLPTYHPANVLRQYPLRAAFSKDLDKALRESHFPELIRPQRFIYIEPDLSDLSKFEEEFLRNAKRISIDIETAGDQITCIGFAPDAAHALVVPFFDPTKADANYWRSIEEELAAWAWVRKQCERKVSQIGQNFNYDMKFTYSSYGIPMMGADHDTMLLAHALQPELKKSLGFLASIYTDEMPWKFMRPKHETVKKED